MNGPTAILLLSILSAFFAMPAKAQDVTLEDGFTIVVTEPANPSISKNVEILTRDIAKAMGSPPKIVRSRDIPAGLTNAVIVVNEEAGRIAGLPSLEGFERHQIYVKNGRIIVHGADELGTIFALYEFSHQFLGVPPLWYWASVPPKPVDSIRIPDDFHFDSGTPHVRYRAWFPNDQDMFSPWRKLSKLNDEILYETMLRLKMNTLEVDSTINYSKTNQIHRTARMIGDYGLYITFHHPSPLNSRMQDWNAYRKLTGQPPVDQYMIADLPQLEEFWRYNVRTLLDNGIDKVLWTVNFRGDGDRPFWVRRSGGTVEDAPTSMPERATLMNDVVARQVEILRDEHDGVFPETRMIFYDEIADFMATGLLKPPAEENLIWNYVAARRDHFPNDDIRNQTVPERIKLGYYMNLQFTSTGSHMAQAEGPWKMEQNFRYVDSKNSTPLTFSVVNAGNIREHVFTLAANAAMMWNFDNYTSDEFTLNFAKEYFGSHLGEEVAVLYRDYFNAYWNQKSSDIPGFDRQYIFHDLRYKQAVAQLTARFFDPVDMNPLTDYPHEQLANRTFRIVPQDTGHENQVEAILSGTKASGERFLDVAQRADDVMVSMERKHVRFFNDNLRSQAYFMAHLNDSLHLYVSAYIEPDAAQQKVLLMRALAAAEEARASLNQRAYAHFSTWFDEERIFDMDGFVASIAATLEKIDSQP